MTPQELADLIVADHGALWGHWVRLPGTPLEVTAQPLRLEGPRGAIVTTTAWGAQRVADALGAYPTTPLIEDLIYRHAGTVCRPSLPSMFSRVHHNDGTWEQSLEYSDYLRQWLDACDPDVLCAAGGKVWALQDGARPGQVHNYGMHVSVQWLDRMGLFHGTPIYPSVSIPEVFVLQGVSDSHNAHHLDYSQQIRLCRPLSGFTPSESIVTYSGRPLRSLRLCL